MAPVSKTESDAYDKVLDAAAELAELIRSHGFAVGEEALEAMTVFLANNAPRVRRILAGRRSPPALPEGPGERMTNAGGFR